METTIDFETALARFVGEVQASVTATYADLIAKGLSNPVIGMDRGPKYVRVWRTDGPSSRSVLLFIDRATGNVLYPAGWKGPAKGIRGSIYRHACESIIASGSARTLR